MPWKETCVMDERMRFVLECNEAEESMTEVCHRCGIIPSQCEGLKDL
jgi:hypothetical protein